MVEDAVAIIALCNTCRETPKEERRLRHRPKQRVAGTEPGCFWIIRNFLASFIDFFTVNVTGRSSSFNGTMVQIVIR